LDLSNLQLDFLVKINFLLPDDVQLLDLAVYYSLSLVKGCVDLRDLVLDLIDLNLSILDHLV